ncbi:MAG: TRAP transporter substrate-binding protein [Pirellulaceae bacterium]|nr:TRAP transporter substrate-binding protein [Planctomycetales bacterium]
MSKSVSIFAVGMVAGILLSTIGFAFVARQLRESQTGSRVTVLKLAHTLPEDHPVHLAMLRMGELLSEKSGGTVELQLFPNEQLGSETDCIEQVQRGALAMTKTSSAPLESFVPELAVFSVPYLFRDREHFWKVLDGELGLQLLDAGASQGMTGLCYYDSGSRNFYTRAAQVKTPDDLKNLKIRVTSSAMSMDMITALGGSPTAIAFGELYTALQTRVVDGAENNEPTFYTSRHYEVCPYFTYDEHSRVPDILLISTDVWNSLSPTVQAWLREAAEESSMYQRELWQQKTEEALDAVKDKGVTVYIPDKSLFAEKVQSIHDRLKGTKVGDLLERIKATK